MTRMLPITYKALLGHIVLFGVLVGSYFFLLDQVVKIFLISKVKKEIMLWIPDLTSPKSETAFKELARYKAQQSTWSLQILKPDGEIYFNVVPENTHANFYEQWQIVQNQRYNVTVPMSFNEQEYQIKVMFDPATLDVGLNDVRKIHVYLGAFFSFVFILLSFAMLAMFSRPIQAIFRSVNNYAMGGQTHLPKIKVEGNSESAVFAKTLNQLTDDLHSLQVALTEEKHNKSAITEALCEGVITLSADMTIQDVNVRGSKLLHTPKSQLVGRALDELKQTKADSILKKCFELAKRAMHNHTIITDSMVLDEPCQTVLDLVAVPLGVNKGLVLIIQDNTNSTQVTSLGKEFIANASHELRTPITIIKGFAEMLHDLPEISESMLEDITEKIVRNCHRMSVLVKNLLVLADLDNLPKAALKENDLMVIIENCRHELSALHPGMELDINAIKQALILNIDGPLIELALMNIFENAIKYSSANAKIDVNIQELDGHIQIDVKDQGIGISSQELEHIFDRFYTVNKAETRKMGGAGLGLSIVRNVVEKHGGELSVQSIIGEGTTFTILLPCGLTPASV